MASSPVPSGTAALEACPRSLQAPVWQQETRFWHSSCGGGWLEDLHRQHVGNRAQLRGDVAQANQLKKELVTFFSLYRDADLGRADDIVREWRCKFPLPTYYIVAWDDSACGGFERHVLVEEVWCGGDQDENWQGRA